MKEFTSIEQFRHVIANIQRYCENKNKPLPTITYKGTVKLHGTNAGIRVTDKRVQAQGRQRVLDIGSDNFGFAAFCHNKNEFFQKLALGILEKPKLKNLDDVTIYGEWIGEGIQKNVAISKLPKHLVIFSAWVGRKTYVPIEQITKNLTEADIQEFNAANIYFVNQVPCYEISIDFSKPASYIEELDRLTLEVENHCPWGMFRGVDGIGEGIVWQPEGDLIEQTDLWFKHKGLKHKKGDGTEVPKSSINPEKVASIQQFVDAVLPEWRLEQGISQLKTDGLKIIPENTGAYLKWIHQDILKEESDVLAANELAWKDVVGAVSKAAREYFLKEVNNEAYGVSS